MREIVTRNGYCCSIFSEVVAVVSGYVLLFSMPLNEKVRPWAGRSWKAKMKPGWKAGGASSSWLQQLTEQLKKQEEMSDICRNMTTCRR